MKRTALSLSLALLAAGAASAARTVIVSEDRAQESWLATSDSARLRGPYPATVEDRAQDVCVSIGYLIDAQGRTSNLMQLKAWSSRSGEREPPAVQVEPFVRVAAAIVSKWTFDPVTGKPRPIYTSSTFTFDGSKTLPAERIGERCRIANLQAFIDRAQGHRRDEASQRSRYERGLEAGMRCTSFSSACVLAAEGR